MQNAASLTLNVNDAAVDTHTLTSPRDRKRRIAIELWVYNRTHF